MRPRNTPPPPPSPPPFKLFDPESPPTEPPPEATPANLFGSDWGTCRLVRDVLDLYIPHSRRRLGKRTNSLRAQEDREHVWQVFAEAFGDRPVEACRPALLEAWIDAQAGLQSDHSRQRWNRTIQRPFNWAAKGGLIARNLFLGVHYKTSKRTRVLTPAEWRTMLRGCGRPPHAALFRRLLVFLWYSCGARPIEMSEAAWDQVKMDQGKVWIQQDDHKTSEATEEPRPRKIVLRPPAVKLLVWLRRHQVPGQRQIFLNARGRPWTHKSLSSLLQRIRRRTGLPKAARFYGARHAFATDYIARGGEQRILAELLGHEGTQMCNRYIHAAGLHREVFDSVDRLFGADPCNHPGALDAIERLTASQASTAGGKPVPSDGAALEAQIAELEHKLAAARQRLAASGPGQTQPGQGPREKATDSLDALARALGNRAQTDARS